MKLIFQTAVAAMLIAATSCGQNTAKQQPTVSEPAAQVNDLRQIDTMDDEQIAALLKEIFSSYPNQ
jgi:hypothetical protein